jgi:hypothetical protein
MQTFRAPDGKVLGQIRESSSGNSYLQDKQGHSKRYYDKNFDATFTMDGHKLSSGNTLAMLLDK